MTRLIELIRTIVQGELASRRPPALAVVTAIHHHTEEDDERNVEVDVRLKHEAVELSRVPVMVPHAGFAMSPGVGDLVVVVFINGCVHEPIILGCLHHADRRAPLHWGGDIVIEHRSDDNVGHLRFTPGGDIVLQQGVGTTTESGADDASAIKAGLRLATDGKVKITGSEVVITNQDATVTITGSEVVITNEDGSVSFTGTTVTGK